MKTESSLHERLPGISLVVGLHVAAGDGCRRRGGFVARVGMHRHDVIRQQSVQLLQQRHVHTVHYPGLEPAFKLGLY